MFSQGSKGELEKMLCVLHHGIDNKYQRVIARSPVQQQALEHRQSCEGVHLGVSGLLDRLVDWAVGERQAKRWLA